MSCHRYAMPLPAVALFCPRLALPPRCCASPSHIGAAPRNAAASLIVAVRCCAIAEPRNPVPLRAVSPLRRGVSARCCVKPLPCNANPALPLRCVSVPIRCGRCCAEPSHARALLCRRCAAHRHAAATPCPAHLSRRYAALASPLRRSSPLRTSMPPQCSPLPWQCIPLPWLCSASLCARRATAYRMLSKITSPSSVRVMRHTNAPYPALRHWHMPRS